MFKLVVVLGLVGLLAAAPADHPHPHDHDHDHDHGVHHEAHSTEKPAFVDIVESDNEHHEDGSYHFSYRGADGTFREETAVWVNPGAEDAYLDVTGSYSFIDADGEEVVVHYKANKDGFVPEGSHIPDEISVAAKQAASLPKDDEHHEPHEHVSGPEARH